MLLTTRYTALNNTPTTANTVPGSVTPLSELVFNTVPNVMAIYK